MPRLVKVSLKEAQGKKTTRKSRGKVLEQYKRYILTLKESEAGKFNIRDDKEGFAIRKRIERAAYALGIKVKVKKRKDTIYFYKKSEK